MHEKDATHSPVLSLQSNDSRGKEKDTNLLLHSGNEMLEEVFHSPGLGHLAIPGAVTRAREMEHTGHTSVTCLLLVPRVGVNSTQITLQNK